MVEIRNSQGDIVGYDDLQNSGAEVMMARFDGRLSRVESNSHDLKCQNLDLKKQIESLDKKVEILMNKQGVILNYMYDAMAATVQIKGIEKELCEEIRPAIKDAQIEIAKINGGLKKAVWLYGSIITIASFLIGYFRSKQQ